MTIVKGRHIRHDWRTFNDRQDQNSVRTLCGRTSTPKSSGIPTVTAQKNWIVDHVNGEQFWGWCWQCTMVLVRGWDEENVGSAHKSILDLYFGLGDRYVEPARSASHIYRMKTGKQTGTPRFPIDTPEQEEADDYPHLPS